MKIDELIRKLYDINFNIIDSSKDGTFKVACDYCDDYFNVIYTKEEDIIYLEYFNFCYKYGRTKGCIYLQGEQLKYVDNLLLLIDKPYVYHSIILSKLIEFNEIVELIVSPYLRSRGFKQVTHNFFMLERDNTNIEINFIHANTPLPFTVEFDIIQQNIIINGYVVNKDIDELIIDEHFLLFSKIPSNQLALEYLYSNDKNYTIESYTEISTLLNNVKLNLNDDFDVTKIPSEYQHFIGNNYE